jgi:hypothetical protein
MKNLFCALLVLVLPVRWQPESVAWLRSEWGYRYSISHNGGNRLLWVLFGIYWMLCRRWWFLKRRLPIWKVVEECPGEFKPQTKRGLGMTNAGAWNLAWYLNYRTRAGRTWAYVDGLLVNTGNYTGYNFWHLEDPEAE